MRIALTIFAVALVAALFAALVGPALVDWSAWRGRIEAELSRRVGAPVTIAGPIQVRLLPTPYLSIEQVSVGAPAKGAVPWLRCAGMRFELAVGALAGGRFRFTEVRLDRPSARVSLSGHVSADVLRDAYVGLARRVELDRIVVDAGRATLERAGKPPFALTDISLEASARSLLGPFRGSGEWATPLGAKARFEFATQEISGAELPVKAEIDAGPSGARATFDGKLAMVPGRELNLRYDGGATFSGALEVLETGDPSPWEVSGALSADSTRARIDRLNLRIGPESRALEATGDAALTLGAAPTLTLKLQSKQLNIDAFLRKKGEESAPPARFWAALSRLADGAATPGRWPLAVRLGFSSPAAFIGARTLEHLNLKASAEEGQPLTGDFEADLPGQSHVRFTGGLEFGAAAELRGRVDARVGDFGELRDWASQGEPEWGARLAAIGDALPQGVAAAKGDVEISSVGFSARNLDLTLDRSRFVGAIAYTRALAGARARLFLDLYSDGLDVDAAPDLTGGGDWLGDLDLSLSVRASKLRVARVGQTSLDGGSLILRATKTGKKLVLDRLSIADLGGATVEAKGEASPAGRWARMTLNAAHLRDFAALIARVAPGRYSRMLVDRAESLSPAKATFEARRDGPPLEGAFPLDFVRADGEAGRSRFALKLSRAPKPVDALAADLSVDSPDAGALLRQIGAEIPAGSGGRAHIEASASGKWETGFDADLAASAGGANLNWRGRIVPEPAGPTDPNLTGAASLEADNALNLLALLGFAVSGSGLVAPVAVSGNVSARGGDVTLPNLSGTIAGGKIVANLAWRAPVEAVGAGWLDSDVALAKAIVGDAPAPASARLSGEVSLDKASAGMLLALPLGVPTAAKPGAHWSEAKFAPPLLTPPTSDVRLRIAALDFLDGTVARDFTARLGMDPGKFDLEDVAMDIAGGHASGRVTLRRIGPEAALSGKLALTGIGVDRTGLSGRIGATLDLAGTGVSPATLMTDLVGQGEVQLDGATIPRLDPDALSRVVSATEASDAPIDETNITHALTLELDRQPLALPDGATPAVLNSGVLRAGPIDVPEPSGRALATGEFDLKAFTLETRVIVEEAHADKFWTGPPPAVTVTSRGGLDAPVRKVDAALLSAGLSARAVARESDRIASLEADIRERAYFNRRLKGERFLASREAEVAAYHLEQARLKFEAERKRVEDSLLEANGERMRATAAAPPPPIARPTSPAGQPKPKGAAPDPTASGFY